jgi:hypothetical protein
VTASNFDSCKIWGLDVRVVTPCRCGCPFIRVHPYSVKSSIPIWKCSWCARRKGRLTETKIKLLEALGSSIRLDFGVAGLPRER